MNPQVQKYIIWSAAIIVVLIAVALISGRTRVKLPVQGS